MATKKTTKKSPITKPRVISGKGGLKQTKFLDWRMFLLIMIAVAAVAGYFIYNSQAASYTFARDARTQMTGGSLRCPAGGDCRRNVTSGSLAKTLVDVKAISITKQICTTVVINQNSPNGNLVLWQYSSTQNIIASKRGAYKAGQRVQLCGSPAKKQDSTIAVYFSSDRNHPDGGLHSAGVFSIYGLR